MYTVESEQYSAREGGSVATRRKFLFVPIIVAGRCAGVGRDQSHTVMALIQIAPVIG